jgi:hypothetical protein
MRVLQLLAQQRDGLAAARTAASQRRALRQALQSKLIRYLLAVGNLAAKDRRELAESPPARALPTHSSHTAGILLRTIPGAPAGLLARAGGAGT